MLNINKLYSGGLITNYYCTSACRHCLYGCSPKWTKDYISYDQALKNLLKIRELGCHSVHIGGGEPMVNFEKLKLVLKAANDASVAIEYIETNSSWYKDDDISRDKLKELLQLGVSTLLISISPFHNEYIPFAKVKGLIIACRGVGMNVFPWVTDFVGDLEQLNDSETHSLNEYIELFGEDYLSSLPGRYALTIKGRCLETFKDELQKHSVDQIIKQNGNGCHELTEVSHFHADLFGNLIPGLCSGLAIKMDNLGAPLDPEQYPILALLYEQGICGLYQMACEEFGFRTDREYLNKCHLCYEIREFLLKEKGKEYKEIAPKEYYSYVMNE